MGLGEMGLGEMGGHPRPRWIKSIAQQAFSDVRPGHLGDRCTLAVSPNGPCVRDGNLAGAHRALGTTVFRSKFFQISRASLPNSMTRCAASFPHTATNLLQPMNPTKYAAFVAGRLPQLTDTVCLPNKLLGAYSAYLFILFCRLLFNPVMCHQ